MHQLLAFYIFEIIESSILMIYLIIDNFIHFCAHLPLFVGANVCSIISKKNHNYQSVFKRVIALSQRQTNVSCSLHYNDFKGKLQFNGKQTREKTMSFINWSFSFVLNKAEWSSELFYVLCSDNRFRYDALEQRRIIN